MGYTSREIDEEMTMADIELLTVLEPEYDRKMIRRNAISTAKGLTGDTK